jgi:hypothetical protein
MMWNGSAYEAGDVHLAEYDRLEQEQLARIGVRDNLVYATLAALGGVTAVAFGGDARLPVLLLFPPVCAILGWIHLTNDQKISAVGRYIRRELVTELAADRGREAGRLLRWETEHRSDPGHRRRKRTQLAVDITTFCVTGATALALYWATAFTASPVVIAVSVTEMAVPTLLAREFHRHCLPAATRHLRRPAAGKSAT